MVLKITFGNSNFRCYLAQYRIHVFYSVFRHKYDFKDNINSKTACKMGSYFNLKEYCLKDGWYCIFLRL